MIRREIVFAIVSGIFFGIAAILIKFALIPTQGFSINSLQDWEKFVFSFPFIGLIFFNTLAVLFMWIALFYGKVIVVVSVVTAFTVLASLVGAVIIFNESISILRAVGIFSLTVGVINLRDSWKKSGPGRN